MTRLTVLNVGLLGLLSWSMVGSLRGAIAQSTDPPSPPEETRPFLRPPTPCPDDIEILVAGLLRDLPGYANRVAARSRITEDRSQTGTVLIAGRAEFEPLEIAPVSFTDSLNLPEDTIQQVFFTTLERLYTASDYVDLESYHWLFLTAAEDGWRLTLMFSRTAVDDSVARPPTPTRESSDGIIGQAVQLWLRDCRAGAVYPIESTEFIDPVETGQ